MMIEGYRCASAALLICSMLGAGAAQAEPREMPRGYIGSASSNLVRTGTGSCLHSSVWSSEMADVVGCDDSELDTTVELVEGTGSGVVAEIVMPSTALFAFDSDVLTDEGKRTVDSYRTTLLDELEEAYAAVIVGHTDSTGDANYNKDLSTRRAQSVRNYLVDTGAPADKLRVVGKGADDPIASNDTNEGRAENRRVEAIVVGELRQLDSVLFPSATLFERRSAALTAEGRETLEGQRAFARGLLQRAPLVEVIGHTDDVGDDAYNQDLSEQRARTIADYLISTGVDTNVIVARGEGENSPITSNATHEGRSQNRRVEVFVLGRTN
ncbi:MAG: OmpA family protein [Geminicoccaceae bacterium]